MPRPSKPWWWKTRSRWAVTIDGRRHTAPPSIGKRDLVAAHQWFARLQEQGESRVVGAPTVADLCEWYLEWDEARIAAGNRAPENHKIGRIKLTRACAASVAGVKVGTIPIARFGPGHLES